MVTQPPDGCFRFSRVATMEVKGKKKFARKNTKPSHEKSRFHKSSGKAAVSKYTSWVGGLYLFSSCRLRVGHCSRVQFILVGEFRGGNSGKKLIRLVVSLLLIQFRHLGRCK